MAKKITVIGGSGFVGTNLCRQLSLKQQDFEIVDLKMSNQFPEKCKIADVRDVDSLRAAVTGNVVVNLAAVHCPSWITQPRCSPNTPLVCRGFDRRHETG